MYFFFDIDGTLTAPLTSEFPESTRKAIRLLRKEGHFVSLATGRLQADAWQVAEALGIPCAVTDGGNALTINGKIIYDYGLPVEACYKTLSEIDYERHPWAVVPENRMVRIALSHTYLDKVSDRYYETMINPSYDFHSAKIIHKIFVACEKGKDREVPLYTLPHVWFRPDTMLIEPIHKERGILEIQRRFHVPDDQIVVFGDGMNDCSMFQNEWMSVAMGNAKPRLKKLAKYITSRADEDGIYNACLHFGWIQQDR